MRPPCEIVVQAAVSHYLHAKRGDKRMKQVESIPSLRLAASEVAQGIASENFTITDAMIVFCELCVSRRRKDAICDLHRDLTALPSNCEACPDVAKR